VRAVIIDDEIPALEGLKFLLQKFGVEVCGTFQNPLLAVDKSAEIRPDVAFIDIEMPGMNGLETAERLLMLLPDLKIIFVTAYHQYAVEAFELAAIDYVLKPVHPQRLERTLSRLRAEPARPARRDEPKEAGGGADEDAGKGQSPVIRFLGRFECLAPDGRRLELHWRTAKAKELFVYLLHKRGSSIPKERLIDLFWPEMEEEKALTNLHTTVYQVRRLLKDQVLPIRLSYIENSYRLDAPDVEFDSERWEAEVKEALQEPLFDSVRLQRLKRLTDAYGGDFLEQEGYLWAEDERHRLRLLWLEAARRAADTAEQAGNTADAAALLVRIRERFPYAEEFHLRLIRLYDRMGLQREADAEFERLVRMQEELGQMPE
jgi:two-component SAPR family response regulator